MQIIFITDLDGTLLGHEDFDFMPVRPAVWELVDCGVHLILASSKTQTEIEKVCDDLGRRLPLICENGASIAHFDLLCDCPSDNNTITAIRGISASALRACWPQVISSDLRNLCTFLEEMDRPSQENLLGLKGSDLDRALDRLYSCLLVFKGSPSQFTTLQEQAIRAGLSVQRGGRVCTLSGRHDKGIYLPEIRRLTTRGNEPCVVVGFGDSENDVEMLKAADIACVIPRPDGYTLPLKKASDAIIIAPCVAPWGWHEAAIGALSLLSEQNDTPSYRGRSNG